MSDILKRIDEAVLSEMTPRKYYGGTEGANIYYFNILKPFVGKKKIGAWEFDMEPMVGTFVFEQPNSDKIVYATPYWEGLDGISIQIGDYDGSSDPITIDQSLPMITGDSKKDSDAYFKLMGQVLKRLK
jgi:hypothetical protein